MFQHVDMIGSKVVEMYSHKSNDYSNKILGYLAICLENLVRNRSGTLNNAFYFN